MRSVNNIVRDILNESSSSKTIIWYKTSEVLPTQKTVSNRNMIVWGTNGNSPHSIIPFEYWVDDDMWLEYGTSTEPPKYWADPVLP